MDDNDDPMKYFRETDESLFHRGDDNDMMWDTTSDLDYLNESFDVTNPTHNEGYVGTMSLSVDPMFMCDDTPKYTGSNIVEFPRSQEDINYNRRMSRRTENLCEEAQTQAILWPNVIKLEEMR